MSLLGGVPAVGGPGYSDEAADDDDATGQGDEGLDGPGSSFGADQ